MPKIVDIHDALDLANKERMGTQFAKSVKMRETTYNFLMDIKNNDKSLKSIDDAILHLILAVAVQQG